MYVPNTEPKTCPVCGKDFTVTHNRGNRKYCSRRCQIARQQNHPKTVKTHTCLRCGKEFQSTNYHQKYCSNGCRYQRSMVTRTCKHCGKQFTIARYKLEGYGKNKRHGTFCSRDCLLDHIRKYPRSVVKTCKECGKDFSQSGYMDHHLPKTYCSRDCFWSARRKQLIEKGYDPSLKGSCRGILKKHHEDLKHDPERLTTKFLADVVGCNCKVIQEKVANGQ